MISIDESQIKRYRHYRTKKLYQFIGIAIHSETYEEMVIYKALYHCDKFGQDRVWVRPKKMFFEDVEHNGKLVPRFQPVNDFDIGND